MKETVFILLPKVIIKGNHPYKACIVDKDEKNNLIFVKWIKPCCYHHNLPEFLREEFTRTNKKLLRPKHVIGLPKAYYTE